MKTIDLNIDSIKELDENYLNKNNKYFIEEALIKSLSNDDIRLFINELYSEFVTLKASLESRIVKDIKEGTSLSEMDKYFILCFNQIFYYDGSRTLELEKILKRFDTKIFVNDIKKSGIKTSYIPIDVNLINITDVISKYVKLPDNLRKNIRCPLGHKDRTPSFRIYTNTNSFYCFSCSKGGGNIKFIAEMENISNKDAFKLFKNLYFK